MAWSKPLKTGGDAPMLHTPKGASPRRLRSDAFFDRSPHGEPARAAPPPEPVEEPASDPPEPRDWDFALPELPPRQTSDPLIEYDANRRCHPGLRLPAETPLIPESSRERYSENWERLAAAPHRERRSRLRRRLENSKTTGWLFTGGRFELNAAAGTVMLVILLTAAFFYGRRLLTNHETKPSPPAKTGTR